MPHQILIGIMFVGAVVFIAYISFAWRLSRSSTSTRSRIMFDGPSSSQIGKLLATIGCFRTELMLVQQLVVQVRFRPPAFLLDLRTQLREAITLGYQSQRVLHELTIHTFSLDATYLEVFNQAEICLGGAVTALSLLQGDTDEGIACQFEPLSKSDGSPNNSTSSALVVRLAELHQIADSVENTWTAIKNLNQRQ